MLARGEKSLGQSPHFRVELDNRALKAKNNSLTQAVAKLQQENADLVKQMTLHHADSFEITSRYNNLKNVLSVIDSTTKRCLPKVNEIVETFTGIIQLCTVASNISNSNTHKDSRTQAVTPQIVNGHVLHNPTITLSRLESNNLPNLSRISSNISVRPSTSRDSNQGNNEVNAHLSGRQESDSSDRDSDSSQNPNEDEPQDNSFVCQATRGVSRRKRSNLGAHTSQQAEEDFVDSDEEMSAANENDADEEDESSSEIDQRLATIPEDEYEEETTSSSSSSGPLSPRARQRSRFLKGRLQEVKIYLNQLPNSYIDQIRGSGNISISVSPPERRSSYKQIRTSSVIGEVNESREDDDNRHLFLEKSISKISRSLNVQLEPFKSCSDSSTNDTSQFSENMSYIHNLPTSKAEPGHDSSNKDKSLTGSSLMSRDVHYKTSTPIVNRKSNVAINQPEPNNSLNKSEKSLTSQTHITERKARSKEKMLSRSPIKITKDIRGLVTSPVSEPYEIRTRRRGIGGSKRQREKSPDPENIEETESKAKNKKDTKKKDSPTKKIVINKDTFTRARLSPKKNPVGRPKRAAKPTSLKEPSLTKKMRRSK